MRSDGVRALFVVVWMAVPGWADVRPADAIREEYAAVWQRLVAREFDVGAREKEARSSDDLRRAWELVGEHVVLAVRYPDDRKVWFLEGYRVDRGPECVACRHQCRRRARLPPWCDARDGLTSARSPR